METGVCLVLCTAPDEASAERVVRPLLEERLALTVRDWVLVTVMGLGPLGAAFFLWDRALKDGDPRTIGILSYVTPLGSTLMLMLFTGRAFSPWVAGAAALIVGAAVVGMRARG